jgi:hypothetical protein
MPMTDVYAAEGPFKDRRSLARDFARPSCAGRVCLTSLVGDNDCRGYRNLR